MILISCNSEMDYFFQLYFNFFFILILLCPEDGVSSICDGNYFQHIAKAKRFNGVLPDF